MNPNSKFFQQSVNLTSNLLNYWTFDAGSGTSVTDSGSAGNTGTLVGSPAYSTTVAPVHFTDPYSINFATTSQYMTTTQVSTFSNNPFTISCWVNTSTSYASQGGRIIANYNGGNTFFGMGFNAGGVVYLIIRDSSGNSLIATSPATYNDGNWHHVCGVRVSASQVYMYVDGILRNQVGQTTVGAVDSTQSVTIGRDISTGASSNYTGLLDDLRVYTRALNGDEVRSLYNGGTTVNSNGLGSVMAYYPFSEGTGTTTADRSGYGNTGTLVGSPSWSSGVVGECLLFNGSSQAVTCGTANPLAILYDLTISMWVYNTATVGGAHALIIHAPSSTSAARPYQIIVDYDYSASAASIGKLCFAHVNTAGTGVYIQASGNPITVNTWHHVIVTRTGNNGTNITMYVDGVSQSVSVVSGSSATIANVAANSTLQIGAYSLASAAYYKGYIDDVRIFDRAMGNTEAREMFFQKKNLYGQ